MIKKEDIKDIVIGIDIGGTNTDLGLVDEFGVVLATERIETNSFETATGFVNGIHKAIMPRLKEYEKNYNLCAIGVGAPNGNYYTGQIENAPNLRWKGVVELQKLVENQFKTPTVITNDANAAALGEMFYGCARGMRNFILITIGTGLGSGIVVNGRMVYGHSGFAGEIGHTIAVRNGRMCGCGRRGCLETYVSARGLVQTFEEIRNAKVRVGASSVESIPSDPFTAEKVYQAALMGDADAMESFEKTGNLLGFVLANSVAYTSPEAIVLFGGLARSGDLLLTPARKSFNDNLLNIFQDKVRLALSALHDKNAAILGASALAWRELCSKGK